MNSLFADMSNGMAVALAGSLPSREAMNQVAAKALKMTVKWEEIAAAATASLRTVDWDAISQTLDRMLPPNLRFRPRHLNLEGLVDFVENDGIPLAYVPRVEIVESLLSAPSREDRERILVDECDHIVEDCLAGLAATTSEEVADLVMLATRAVQVLAAGHHEAAQALSTTVLDTTLSRMIPDKAARGKFTKAKSGKPVPPAVSDVRRLVDLMVWHSVYHSHGEFWPNQGHPVPAVYSRHATVHAAGPIQYTAANAVQSVMVVTCLLSHADAVGLGAPDVIPSRD
ncbi:hypothetical protein [Micrococcus lylae]|uniref:hypothetical protein n=1 Tax=Micrococcus lylae TaxID=1273 RepID=UPI0011AF47F6|nr:hypothetical protein [Micrococcus lylae]WIK82900.1 hypothetical protein CJ228_003615 [Micrococcus lylae]